MSSVQEELNNTQDMLQGYVELYNYSLSYVKTMAIGCAIQLGIPSAIHRLGGAATISDIITETGVDPSKLPYLRRLMRVLTVSSILGRAPQAQMRATTVLFTSSLRRPASS